MATSFANEISFSFLSNIKSQFMLVSMFVYFDSPRMPLPSEHDSNLLEPEPGTSGIEKRAPSGEKDFSPRSN